MTDGCGVHGLKDGETYRRESRGGGWTKPTARKQAAMAERVVEKQRGARDTRGRVRGGEGLSDTTRALQRRYCAVCIGRVSAYAPQKNLYACVRWPRYSVLFHLASGGWARERALHMGRRWARRFRKAAPHLPMAAAQNPMDTARTLPDTRIF